MNEIYCNKFWIFLEYYLKFSIKDLTINSEFPFKGKYKFSVIAGGSGIATSNPNLTMYSAEEIQKYNYKPGNK